MRWIVNKGQSIPIIETNSKTKYAVRLRDEQIVIAPLPFADMLKKLEQIRYRSNQDNNFLQIYENETNKAIETFIIESFFETL